MRALLAEASARVGAIGAIGVSAWFVLMVAVGAGLLAKHLVALPAPVAGPQLAASVSTFRTPANRGKWMAVHVLYAECRCSQRIVDHLVASERPKDWSEVVLWIGHPDPSPALEARFDVRRVAPSDLARYGIESAPMLIAADPQGAIRYAGGYTEQKQGPVIDDLRILDAAQRPLRFANLPVFGCAVSDRLKRELSALPTL